MTAGPIAFCSASVAGPRAKNDDACAFHHAAGSELLYRGSLAAIADGVSAAAAGGTAAQAAVSGFLSDYYSTPHTWDVKLAVARVLQSLNCWLYRQGGGTASASQGWLTTFSAVIFKGANAHLIHIGDSRIYRLRDRKLECLSRDHCTPLGNGRTFLSRALGMDSHIELDYRSIPLNPDDIFLLTTDGVHDYLSPERIGQIVCTGGASAVQKLVASAEAAGSTDNMSAVVCRVLTIEDPDQDGLLSSDRLLPFPPDLKPGQILDGYLILQELHASARSQLYLARDTESGQLYALKTPSINFADNPAYIESFIAEEWTGRRLNHPGIIRIYSPKAERSFLYHVMEYVDGQNLRQWMQLNPHQSVEQVRGLVGQLISALRRLQRMEIVHGDLKPENIMVTAEGRLKLIDLGGASAAGLQEHLRYQRDRPPGSKNYAAPEYFFGDSAGHRSDIFSLGVIAYELLTDHYPYPERFGSQHYQLKSYASMKYTSARSYRPSLPIWIDAALARACRPDPRQRYATLSEFLHDLQTPRPEYARLESQPLAQRNPVKFWQVVAVLLLLSHLLHLL